MSKSLHRIGLLALSLAAVAGCDMFKGDKKASTPSAAKADVAAEKKVAFAKIGPSKAAATQPANNNVTGKVLFTESDGRVYIIADVSGLEPNSKHGFHIHEKGDLSAPDLSSAGAHFDPMAAKHHGEPNDMKHATNHAGDLGNLNADSKGNAHLELTVTDLTIDGPTNAVLGRSVIVHAKVDDFQTQPTGNSGGRVAGGVIERQP